MGNHSSQVEPIKNFSTGNFEGLWYEIAKFPNELTNDSTSATFHFKMNSLSMEMNVSRNTSLGDNRSIIYSLLFIKKDEGIGEIELKNGKKISIIIYWTDYHNYAILGSRDKGYLWILSRSNRYSEDMLTLLKIASKGLGFNTIKLTTVNLSDGYKSTVSHYDNIEYYEDSSLDSYPIYSNYNNDSDI